MRSVKNGWILSRKALGKVEDIEKFGKKEEDWGKLGKRMAQTLGIERVSSGLLDGKKSELGWGREVEDEWNTRRGLREFRETVSGGIGEEERERKGRKDKIKKTETNQKAHAKRETEGQPTEQS